MIKKSDVSKVELQKEQLITQLELLNINIEQVMNALKFSMGIPFNQIIQIDTKIENKDLETYSTILPVDLELVGCHNKLLSAS